MNRIIRLLFLATALGHPYLESMEASSPEAELEQLRKLEENIRENEARRGCESRACFMVGKFFSKVFCRKHSVPIAPDLEEGYVPGISKPYLASIRAKEKLIDGLNKEHIKLIRQRADVYGKIKYRWCKSEKDHKEWTNDLEEIAQLQKANIQQVFKILDEAKKLADARSKTGNEAEKRYARGQFLAMDQYQRTGYWSTLATLWWLYGNADDLKDMQAAKKEEAASAQEQQPQENMYHED